MSQRATKDDPNKQAPDRSKAQRERNQALIDLLNAWEQEDQGEQQETLNILARSLDEDRPSSRKLFARP